MPYEVCAISDIITYHNMVEGCKSEVTNEDGSIVSLIDYVLECALGVQDLLYTKTIM